jgi:integrase/recombinase XerD
LRGQKANAQSLASVIQETFRLWRKHHLGYDQTKYVVEEARRRLGLEPPRARKRTVQRLDLGEIERLIQATYRSKSKYGLMIKTLFQTGGPRG